MAKRAKSLRELAYRVQLTSAPLRELQGAYLERFLDAFTAVVHKDRHLRGATTSADLLLRRIYLTAVIEDAGGDPRTALALVSEAFHAGARAASEKLRLERVGVHVVESLVEVLEDDEEDRQELLGTPDIAMRLGISRERVRQLVAMPGRFPLPVARVRGTHVWRWGDIADWLAVDGRRKPGRPRKVQTDTPAVAPAKRKRTAA